MLSVQLNKLSLARRWAPLMQWGGEAVTYGINQEAKMADLQWGHTGISQWLSSRSPSKFLIEFKELYHCYTAYLMAIEMFPQSDTKHLWPVVSDDSGSLKVNGPNNYSKYNKPSL